MELFEVIIATLGSILDSQLSWESGKFQLARWSHAVALLSDRIYFYLLLNLREPTHPQLSFFFQCCAVSPSQFFPQSIKYVRQYFLKKPLGFYHPQDGHPPIQGWSPTRRKYSTNSINYCHTRLHLGFSAKLRIWQVPTCKMEPRSGIIIAKIQPASQPTIQPASQPSPAYLSFHCINDMCGVPPPLLSNILEFCVVFPPQLAYLTRYPQLECAVSPPCIANF